MKVIFFGSSKLSAIVLDALISGGVEVPLVITKAPKKKGRGKSETATPLGKAARNLSLNLIEEDEPNPVFVEEKIRETNVETFVLVSYGAILKENILKIAKYPLNIHPSILPKYRGASPVARALMNGEKKTGITIFIMGIGVDTGDIIRVKEVPILPLEVRTELEERLFGEAAQPILSVLMDIEGGEEIRRLSQDNSKASYASKITKEECRIDWSKTSSEIVGKVRGLSYHPGAYCTFRDKKIKILRAVRLADVQDMGYPGEVMDTKENITVRCGEGAVEVKEVQLQSRNKIDAKSFVNGYHIKAGEILVC
jgi:methionyl-tRNA formyltransferase